MTTYTVAADGTTSPTNPAFPQLVINDSLLPDGSYDTTTTNPQVFITGGNYTLQSLFIDTSIEVDLGGGLFSTGNERLTGSGSITGATPAFPPDPTTSTPINPAFVNSGFLDINGTIAVALVNNATIAVSSGERLDVEGDFTGFGASTITVASGAELDLNSQNTVNISALSSQGMLKITAPSTRITGNTTFGGTVLVQGDAQNGAGNGTSVARSTGNANGTYVAALDLRNAAFSAPITSLTLAQDASISFGSGASIARFAVAGASTALIPLDLVNVEGTLTVTGDGTGATNSVSISQARFAGSSASTGTGLNTVDFKVAASDGGAILINQITIDANTILRNDAAMKIGGQANATSTTTVGATAAAAGSSFINGTGAQLTIAAGAALNVAAIQNAGAITVSGNTTFLQSLTNTGTVTVTVGTLALEAAVGGTGGTFAVANGATLSLDAASAQSVSIAAGGTLRLSQPANFTGILQMPATGARIDLAGITATAAIVSNGTIAVTTLTGTLTFAETGLVNGSALGLSTDGAGGSFLTVADTPITTTPTNPTTPANPTTPPSTNPVAYRFFDSIHGTQFLTTSATERQTIQSTRPDLVYEGVGLNAVDPATDSTAAAVYRFFDTKFGTHFYTSSATERDTVLATRTDLVSEGVGFYEHNTAQAGDVPVYRFFDSNFGTHFYTASNTERVSIVATRPDLIAEGVSFYAPSNAVA